MNLAFALVLVIAVAVLYPVVSGLKCPGSLAPVCANQAARIASLVCVVWLILAVIMPFLTRPRFF